MLLQGFSKGVTMVLQGCYRPTVPWAGDMTRTGAGREGLGWRVFVCGERGEMRGGLAVDKGLLKERKGRLGAGKGQMC
jgi:hypothetical protein